MREFAMCIRLAFLILWVSVALCEFAACESPRVLEPGTKPDDSRLADLKTLNGYFPFQAVTDKNEWAKRSTDIKRRILISQGLWPEPTKSKLHAVVHGKLEFDDYTVERVYFQSIPGHYVTGSLFRPKGKQGPFPAVLCPHGHWKDARFYDAGEKAARQYVAIGAERFINGGRNHIQARCVQLARMGCIAFFYDMTGNCDSIQIGHRPDEKWDRLDKPQDWGFFSVQAELRLQNMMGLQTWNSVRAIDFLLELSDVDPKRIGVTGASGGGTQSMIIAAIDERISAAMPCVMVSTAMQGGCTCENAPLLRIDQGNVDIAAAIAPRPLALTAADDWTVELETKGYPALKSLYEMLGKRNLLTAAFNIHFKHNYNHVNRVVAYSFFNRHFKLGLQEPILERDFELLTKEDLTVWDDQHPAPTGSAIGDAHEVAILKLADSDATQKTRELIPDSNLDYEKYREIIGGAWETIFARRLEDVANISFQETTSKTIDGFKVQLGMLSHKPVGELIPAIQIRQKSTKPQGTVVWVPNRDKAELFDDDGFHPKAKQLLDAGFDVVSADLIGQGEFLDSDGPLETQRMWYQRDGSKGWELFAGYTYGYNHSLFIQRTHDVLSLIKFASHGSPVHLFGIGETAGAIALAARSQASSAVKHTITDLNGFRFQSLTRHDDPMFVSGAVRYLDVEGLLSLCAPNEIFTSGIDVATATRVYEAADARQSLKSNDANGAWTAFISALKK